MKKPYLTLLLSALMGCAASVVRAEHANAHVTEQDYLSEMPVVLSVTHMAQPLDEVPGALTIIDREMIRRSGAREVADLLRLVPGFLMTRTQGGLVVGYHAGLDTYGSRMQVYVDGRSVYSSLYLGGTQHGLRGLVLEDIERIEVLRGSNSASFGANAFLGVVNVVTRHTLDTRGAMISVTRGDGRIDDNVARIGWGDQTASFRITASRRQDSGLYNADDDGNLSRLGLRADLQVTPRDKVLIELGTGDISHIIGRNTVTNPNRPTQVDDVYVNSAWERNLDDGSAIKTRFTHDVERRRESYLYPVAPGPGIVSTNGRVERTEVGAQYLTSLNDSLRGVAGVEYRREAAESFQLFFTTATVAAQQWRLFGNLEWRISQNWLLQVGGMKESHSIVGDSFSPRLAAHYHVLPDHTLRVVSTKAFRAPVLVDLRGDIRIFNSNTGALASHSYLARDGLRYEHVRSDELGYFGRVRELGLTLDVRAFMEKVNDRIVWTGTPQYATNVRGPLIRGYEYSLTWEPRNGTKILFNDVRIGRIPGGITGENQESPVNTSSLSWFQNLPGGFEGTLISSFVSPMQWNDGSKIGIARRLDVRLGKPFKFGATKGEIAATTQSINGGHFIHKTELAPGPWKQDRRAFLTLRLDF
jgi:iron complex outermembrane receptor protein